MKIHLLLLSVGVLVLGSAARADLKVISVSCSSGAPVNEAETVKVGDVFERIEPVHPDGFVGQTLVVPMTHNPGEYRTGSPPCPVGDRLQIEMTVVPSKGIASPSSTN